MLRVQRFVLESQGKTAWQSWLATEALAGAAAADGDWQRVETAQFRFGTGFVSARSDARAKWNFSGQAFRLWAPRGPQWAPRGPQWGRAELLLDGKSLGTIDFRADEPQNSAVLIEKKLSPGNHALVLQVENGAVPCDVLEVAVAPPQNAVSPQPKL